MSLITFSSLRVKLLISKCYKKKNFFKKLKGLLYSLKKHSKELHLTNSSDH